MSWRPIVLVALAAVTVQRASYRHVISGTVRGAQGGVPDGVTVTVCTPQELPSGCGRPLALGANGVFHSAALPDGTYVLVVGPSPNAGEQGAFAERALRVVTLAGADVPGILVRTTRYSLRGTYVMRSDDTAAKAPPQIHLVARLVIGDSTYPADESGSTGAPDGEFVLDNVPGPRVLRAGYLSGGDKWWPWQVLLDGVDITDTPTDFSQHPRARLEYVFTRHPARIDGRLVDASGRGLTRAWVIRFSADRALWTEWASTTATTQAGPNGAFSFTGRPGRYLVAALPPTPYQVRPPSPSFPDLARTATEVSVADRGRADVVVTLKPVAGSW